MGIDCKTEFECLLSAADIQKRIKELAAEIDRDYGSDRIMAVGILNGAVLFMADLIRELTVPVEYDFVGFKSYVGSESNGDIEVTKRIKGDIAGKRILIVEDIIDTGRTLCESNLISKLIDKGAVDVKVCCLLDKPSRRTHTVNIHYTGFTIDDQFVVGYGLDYDGLYRNLPYIGIFDPELHK